MTKRDSGRAVAALVVAAVALSSCSARRHRVGKEHFEESLARARSERAVSDGIEKELMPAGAEKKADGAPLEPGEPIWIRSGKTRILQLRGTGPGRKNVLRLVPPMTTTEADIDRALSIIDAALAGAEGHTPRIGRKGARPTSVR